jgi:hypothetical protein
VGGGQRRKKQKKIEGRGENQKIKTGGSNKTKR